MNLEELYAKLGTYAAVSRHTGIPVTTVKDRLRAIRGAATASDPSTGTTLPPPPSGKRQTALEDEVRALRKELREAHRDELDADRIRDLAFGLGSAKPDVVKWTLKPKKGGSGAGMPITFWSDWHYGEVVRKDEMAGVNEYSPAIARERIKRLVERTMDLTLSHQVDADYPGIIIGLGGDMVSGKHHEELAETNSLSDLEAIKELSEILVWGIEEFGREFKKIVIPCVVGNHDRISDRPRYKGRVVNSYAWMLYTFTEKILKERGKANVQFIIPPTFDTPVQVYDHTYLFTHGDSMGVKGGDGQVGMVGPIVRGAGKIVRQYQTQGVKVDTVVMGHWHTYMCLPGVIVNSSIKGFDEFALGNRFSPEPPTQALWFHHPTYGITSRWPVFVDSPTLPEPTTYSVNMP